LRLRWLSVAAAVVIVAGTVPIYFWLGSEFMPPLNEGTILYMPTALPGMSITQARAAIQTQDRMIKQFPEVDHVFGKAGRAETPTDPAPLSMFETVVTLKPEEEWPAGMTWDKLLAEMDRTIRFPGMPNIWWMPIKTLAGMLATGIRSVLGVKVYGPDLTEIGRIAREIEGAVATLPGTRSAFAERTTGGYYLDFTVRRDAIARYGLTVGDVQDVIESAIGGASVSQTVEGRERYSINVRYLRDARSDLERLNLPPGYRLSWAGQFEYLERARGRLALLVPLTLLIVFVLLYLNTASVTKTMIILLAVPFSAVGAIWLLWALGYNMSVAVWVGLIALLGVDAETGVFMLLYLDLAFDERRRRGLMRSLADLKEAIIEGAVKR